ncbi:IS3 family transposase [Alicyclobacillus acidocaldarius]|uniref:IS3 family transposase n=1 Tax=Alicyclobacillus acidocaldarius TaxID=405212 RepID=UPI00192BFD0F|nr:IS3 family transposase [Alicyclobacillus acidocaldarius]
MTQKYDNDFKLHAVQLALEGHKAASEIARDLGISVKSLYGWIAKYREDPETPFVGSGNLRPEAKAMRDLEWENRQLREENEIPKKSHAHLHQRPEVVYAWIHKHRSEFPVQKMCKVLGVSRSGYYAWRGRPESLRAKRRKRRIRRIHELFLQSRRLYGSPKITALLRRDGERIAQKTVARLMREHGLRSRTVRKYKATTDSKHRHPVHENVLNQRFVAERPGQVYMADITYIPTDEGWVYLASVEDLYSRKIVGWNAGARMSKELCIRALEQAHKHRQQRDGVVLHHSDRGSQYASHEYQNRLRAYGMTASMSRKGNCYDNACMESFHSVLKRELVYLERFRTRAEAIRRIFEYIEIWYNRQRIHGAVGYRTPDDVERQYFEAKLKGVGADGQVSA